MVLSLFIQSYPASSTNLYSSVPTTLWTFFSPKPLRKISRMICQQWRWNRNEIQIQTQKKQFWISFPESKNQYAPLAPKLPYLEFSIPLQENETVAFIRTVKVEWERLPLQTSQLAINNDLFTFQEDQVSAKSFGVNLPDCYPVRSFEYSVGWIDPHPILYIKLFPLHTWENYIWLIEQLSIEVGLCASKIPKNEEINQKHSVIIAPTELLDEAKQLGLFQQKSGYAVNVVPIAHIKNWKVDIEPIDLTYMVGYREVNESERAQIPEYDYETADKIRAFLRHLLKLNQIHYLTLFGDATFIPPSEYVISTGNSDPYDKMIPTDLFYMAPEAAGREIPLRIISGRIPARTKEEARIYLSKNNQFRFQNQDEWNKSVALFGGDMFDDDYYGELQCSFMKNSGLFGDFPVTKYYQTDNQYNRDVLANVMKENKYGFMVVSSHGRGDYLRLPNGYLDSSDIMHQPPTSHFPVWVSNACLNGSWDTRLSGIRYGTDPKLPLPTSFSEALLFSKAGAIAYVGGARVNYAGMAYNSNMGEMEVFQLYNIDGMMHYFFEGYKTKGQTLGEIFFLSTRKFIQYDFDNGYEYTLKTLFGWCLLGDPTLPLPDKKQTEGKPVQIIKKPSTLTGPWVESSPNLDLSLENTFEVKGKANTLKVTLCNYNDYKKGSEKTVLKRESSLATFQYSLPTINKTRFALRFEDPDGFETRYVAYGRHADDIALKPPTIFTRLTQGEPFEFSLIVKNIGFTSAKEVIIDQTGFSGSKYLQSLPNLDSFSEYSIPVSIDTTQSGFFKWKFSCKMEKQDLDDSDNSIEVDFWISDIPYQRVGVLAFVWQGVDGQISDTLSLSQINEYYHEKSLPIEVKAMTQDDLDNMESLHLSTLVLYKIRPVSDKKLLKDLIQFEKNGGSVLVMGTFDSQLSSLMGIRHSSDFALRDGDSSFQSFSLMKSKMTFFSKASYSLPCFESYAVYLSDITKCLLDSAYILGFTEDKILYLLQNHRWITYSGVISKLDFARSSETFVFFADLLRYCANQKKSE